MFTITIFPSSYIQTNSSLHFWLSTTMTINEKWRKSDLSRWKLPDYWEWTTRATFHNFSSLWISPFPHSFQFFFQCVLFFHSLRHLFILQSLSKAWALTNFVFSSSSIFWVQFSLLLPAFEYNLKLFMLITNNNQHSIIKQYKNKMEMKKKKHSKKKTQFEFNFISFLIFYSSFFSAFLLLPSLYINFTIPQHTPHRQREKAAEWLSSDPIIKLKNWEIPWISFHFFMDRNFLWHNK